MNLSFFFGRWVCNKDLLYHTSHHRLLRLFSGAVSAGQPHKYPRYPCGTFAPYDTMQYFLLPHQVWNVFCIPTMFYTGNLTISWADSKVFCWHPTVSHTQRHTGPLRSSLCKKFCSVALHCTFKKFHWGCHRTTSLKTEFYQLLQLISLRKYDFI